MFCNKCGAELEDGLKMCPSCGEQFGGDDKKLKIAVTVLCILLLAAVLTVVIVMSMKNKNAEPAKTDSVSTTQETGDGEQTTEPAAQLSSVSYSVSDDVLSADRDQVVAKMGDYEMTVAQLQLYYWFQVYMYYENYQEYIYYGYISLDIMSPLDTQPCAENPNISWQEYFLTKALTTWRSYVVMNMMADAEGFELPADTMENMRADTLADAKEEGFEDVDEYVINMLRKDVGSVVTVEDYWSYMEFVNRATSYFAMWYEKALPADAEVEAYYTENEATLVANGQGKDAGNIVDVRHILIMTQNEDWAAAEKKANEIYQQWLDGGATEELFAELAGTYTEDSGSATTGGLYTDVVSGQMVEVFNDWIMDDSRQPGDSAVLKADYHYQGYHIMYFVSGEPVWKQAVQQALITEKSTAMVQDSLEKWPIEKVEENLKLGTPAFE